LEIAFHKRLVDRVQAGSVLPLGLSAHYLIEPDFHGSQEDLLHAVRGLLDQGHRVIIAHVERITAFQRNYDPLLRLARQGLEIQVNSGSLLDHFDERCRKTALELLANDCVHYLASDAHGARRRTPPSPEERQRLADLINPETLARLWQTNPARLLDPLPESIHHPPVDNAL
jgi:protein-tyrosine phosphatase